MRSAVRHRERGAPLFGGTYAWADRGAGARSRVRTLWSPPRADARRADSRDRGHQNGRRDGQRYGGAPPYGGWKVINSPYCRFALFSVNSCNYAEDRGETGRRIYERQLPKNGAVFALCLNSVRIPTSIFMAKKSKTKSAKGGSDSGGKKKAAKKSASKRTRARSGARSKARRSATSRSSRTRTVVAAKPGVKPAGKTAKKQLKPLNSGPGRVPVGRGSDKTQ